MIAILLGISVLASLVMDGFDFWEAEQAKAISLGPENDVLLEATPQAEVLAVSEADGLILGKAPLRFLVPPHPPVTVLLTAPGRIAERVTLPKNGGTTVHLNPRLPTDPICRVRIIDTLGIKYVGALGGGPTAEGVLEVHGTTVLVSEPRGYGAWLLSCPKDVASDTVQELKLGRRINPPSSIRVRRPLGAVVMQSGRFIGEAPVEWQLGQAFVQIGVEVPGQPVQERWVAAPIPVDLSFPSGRKAPALQLPGSRLAPPQELKRANLDKARS